MKVLVIALVALGMCVVFVATSGRAGQVGAQSVTPRLGEQTFGWGVAAKPAIMTQENALATAKAMFDSTLFTHPFTIEYGSIVTGRRVQDQATGEWHDMGPRDVWKITITGLNLPSPGGRRPGANAPILYAHTLVIYIDD